MTAGVANHVTIRDRVGEVSTYPWALLVLRLAVGIIFIMHGAQKTFGMFGGHDLSASAQSMTKMGIPIALAYVSILTELLGGVALILGVLSRVAAVGLFINMVVAVAMVHFANGFFSMGPKGPGYEYNFALLAMTLAIVIAGPGAFAISDWEGKLLSRE